MVQCVAAFGTKTYGVKCLRVRDKLKKRAEYIALQHEFVQEPSKLRGQWHEYFGRTAPLHIEVGMGAGKFITTLASMQPEINYVGIEKYMEVIIQAYKKKSALNLNNLALLCKNANTINEIFGEAEVERIYLNFSDPWPKKKHTNLRLTSSQFLDNYQQILTPGGQLHFKTDNEDFFDFSLASFTQAGWDLQQITRDLHKTADTDNVMTEYEEYFRKQGKPIFRVVAGRP